MSDQIIFFGSGPVSAKSLSDLVGQFKFEAVITKPGDNKNPNPVEAVALKHGLRLLQATNKAELDVVFAQTSFNSRIGLVIDYGIIISRRVIDAFELGIINSHFSLLPQWRGADPISFAILSGQPKTGVSLMLIDEKLDEGPLLFQQDYVIPPSASTPQLTADLIDLSNQLIQSVAPKYLAGEIKPYPQDPAQQPTYSRKITKPDGLIDWHKPADQLEREIRAFIDWPKSYTKLAGRQLTITEARVVDQAGQAGHVYLPDKSHLIIYTGKQALEILKLKPADKPEMSAEAFLAGYRTYLS